jgi:trans-2,3-dihydro-3-hydroxyanthranilate isomerase
MTMSRTRYAYYTCDVFTDTRFSGNPLAVLPDATGLTEPQMQQIAREFGYSESSFVFPAEAGNASRVRIFTPRREVPFAGHPNVGTAFVLASTGRLGVIRGAHTVTFEEGAGPVSVTIHESGGRITACEVAAPQSLTLGRTVPVPALARAVSLDADDIVTATHPPREASVGLPFVFVELRDVAALERARVDLGGFDAILSGGIRPMIHLYVRTSDGFDVHARMFAPLSGVPEDPATGSAACALAGLLADRDGRAAGGFTWRIAQGVEMGRPSTLVARAEKGDGTVRRTWVGGPSVLVSEGVLHLA